MLILAPTLTFPLPNAARNIALVGLVRAPVTEIRLPRELNVTESENEIVPVTMTVNGSERLVDLGAIELSDRLRQYYHLSLAEQTVGSRLAMLGNAILRELEANEMKPPETLEEIDVVPLILTTVMTLDALTAGIVGELLAKETATANGTTIVDLTSGARIDLLETKNEKGRRSLRGWAITFPNLAIPRVVYLVDEHKMMI